MNEMPKAEIVMNASAAFLRTKLNPCWRFFMVAIPVTGSEEKRSVVRTDCAHDPKALAAVLREAANYYDPQN